LWTVHGKQQFLKNLGLNILAICHTIDIMWSEALQYEKFGIACFSEKDKITTKNLKTRMD
jgi:hypothetical protein